MPTALMPDDQNGDAIQTLAPENTSNVTVTGSSSSTSLPSATVSGDVVRLASDQDCYVEFGGSGVSASASSLLFMAGVEFFKVPLGATHVAALQLSTAGVLTITRMV